MNKRGILRHSSPTPLRHHPHSSQSRAPLRLWLPSPGRSSAPGCHGGPLVSRQRPALPRRLPSGPPSAASPPRHRRLPLRTPRPFCPSPGWRARTAAARPPLPSRYCPLPPLLRAIKRGGTTTDTSTCEVRWIKSTATHF